MADKDKTKEQLLSEISRLRQRIFALEVKSDRSKHTEKMLAAAEDRYRDLVENADIAILIDDRDGKFKYFNEKFLSLFGYTAEEMKDQLIQTLVHPEDVEEVIKHHGDRINGEDIASRYEFRGIRKDGSILHLEVDAIPLKMGESIVGSRSYLWDIGARKKVEQELQRAREDLEKRVEARTAELKTINEKLQQKITEFTNAEERLERSERKYRSLVETIQEGMGIVDPDENIVFANSSFCDILGYSQEELIGMNLRDLVPEEEFQKILKGTAKRKKGISDQYELVMKRKDGELRYIKNSVSPWINQEGEFQGTLGMVIDITEQKRAGDTLKKAEEEKAIILDSITEHVVYHDENLKILWANKAAAKSVGMTTEQLMGCYCYEIGYVDRSSPCQDCPLLKAIEKGQSESGEVTTSDGRKWFVRGYPVRNTSGEIVGAVEVTVDVTVLKLAEEALRESEEKYKTLTENINVGIYRNTVGPKGKFIEANPAIVRMFGFENKDEFLETNVSDLYQNPDDRKRFNEKMLTRGYVHEEELQLKKKNGTPFHGSVSAVAVKDEQGKVKYYDGIVEDVTERKIAEQALRESYEKLKRVLNGTVNALASATEKRDPYTAGHQHRVAQLACAIAREMGISGEDIEGIRVAGIVHDIGKIYVAAELLNRPVKLQEIEMALIKAHCQAGYEILKTVEFPWPVARIVLQHHERLDGSGYPNGLPGKDILLGAKILAVADVVEAMVSRRPYRSALGVNKALDEIRENRGRFYHPDVVDACLRIFDKGFEFK